MSVQGADPTKVVGQKVANPTKLQLAQAIADVLTIERPLQSRGSSVDSTFLDRVHTALTGDTSTQTDAYRKAERVLQDVGLTYDPFWDTSESAGDTGGSTVTNRAYSRILAAVAHVPRCFVINVNDAEAGARWETDHEFRYAYDSTVSGRANFTDAGPGSRVVYYATSSHKKNPMHFIAHAEVTYIGPGWTGPWQATITNYTEFKRPVPVGEFEMEGWNRQISITEISHGTYLDLLVAAESLETALSEDAIRDPGGEIVAQRVLEELPLPQTAPALAVPHFLPLEDVTLRPRASPSTRSRRPARLSRPATCRPPRTPHETSLLRRGLLSL